MTTSDLTRGSIRAGEWVLAIAGAVAALVGLLSFVASEDVYVGLGGEAAWPVADLAPALGYALLLGGIAAVLLAGALVRWEHRHPGPVRPRSPRADLRAHAIAFVLVNSLIWAQDLALGGGLEYAYVITAMWAIGLLAHTVVTVVEERRQNVG